MKGARVPYSATELAFIEAHKDMPRRELHVAFVAAFGREDVTSGHLRSLCTRNGWARREYWRDEDDTLLRTLYPDTCTKEIARRIKRSLSATYGRAKKLGLSKSEAYLASPAACRLRRGDHVGAAYQFKKGQAPANKGLRRPGWSPGRMKDTQFTKGQAGHNWKPIGSERIVDGYRYTKVSDRRCVPWTKNWKPTHVLRWEAINCPIPKGSMALKSLDGDRLNVHPGNWVLIPRAMLPRLNGGRHGVLTYDEAPAELKPTLLALAKVQHASRIARRKSKEARSA